MILLCHAPDDVVQERRDARGRSRRVWRHVRGLHHLAGAPVRLELSEHDEHQGRKERRQSSMKGELVKGDAVWFHHADRGRIDGNVKKVKYKKAIVQTKTGSWDVPFHMLRKA